MAAKLDRLIYQPDPSGANAMFGNRADLLHRSWQSRWTWLSLYLNEICVKYRRRHYISTSIWFAHLQRQVRSSAVRMAVRSDVFEFFDCLSLEQRKLIWCVFHNARAYTATHLELRICKHWPADLGVIPFGMSRPVCITIPLPVVYCRLLQWWCSVGNWFTALWWAITDVRVMELMVYVLVSSAVHSCQEFSLLELCLWSSSLFCL